MPPHVVTLLAIHIVIGSALLILGWRLKRSFRWVVIIVGAAEIGGVRCCLRSRSAPLRFCDPGDW